MSDRFPAIISIGGQVSRFKTLVDDKNTTVLEGLINALYNDGASHEFGGHCISIKCTDNELLEYLEDNVLVFRHDQARYGEFENTEEFCQNNGIPYNQWSDSFCEYQAQKTYWRPGMKRALIQYCDSGGYEVVSGKNVRLALDLLKNYTKKSTHIDGDRDEELLNAAFDILMKECSPLPTKLPKFEIVE